MRRGACGPFFGTFGFSYAQLVMTTDLHSPSISRNDESKPALLCEVRWPDEQVAFQRAALGLIDGESLSVPPSSERLAELLRMAGDLGLIMAHVPQSARGPGHGLAASLLASEAFAASTVWSSIFESTLTYGVDPLLLRLEPKGPLWDLLRSFGLGDRAGIEPHGLSPTSSECDDPEGRPVALMRRLRNSFSRVGSTVFLLDRTAPLFLRPPSHTARPDGGFRGRLATAVARMDLARLLSHNAGRRSDELASAPSTSDDPSASLRSALLDTAHLINLSDLCSWFALTSATALIEETFGSIEQGPARDLCDEASIHLDLRRRLGLRSSLDAAAELFGPAPDGEEPARPSVGSRDLAFKESPLSSAASQTASLILPRMMDAPMDERVETHHPFLDLIAFALRLEIDAALTKDAPPIKCAPSTLVSILSSSQPACEVVRLGTRILERVASESTRSSAVSDLERLWRHGPLRRRLDDEIRLDLGDDASSPSPSALLEAKIKALPDPRARRDELRLAADSGLFDAIEGIDSDGRRDWFASTLFWTETFARVATDHGLVVPSAVQALDPFVLLREDLTKELREKLSSGLSAFAETPVSWEAFDAVRASPREGDHHLLEGRIEKVAFLDSSDLLSVPCTLASGQRAFHILPRQSQNIESRYIGDDPSGIPLHSVDFRGVMVSAKECLGISDEEIEALLVLRASRDALGFLAMARAHCPSFLSNESHRVEASEGVVPGDRERSVLEARLSSANLLCRSSLSCIGDDFASATAKQTGPALAGALIDRVLQVGLACLSAWYAFQCAVSASDLPTAASLLAKARTRFDEGVLLSISRDLPEELATGLEPGEVSADLRDSLPAAAVHRAALQVRNRVSSESSRVRWCDEDLTLLFTAGTALDIAAGLGQPLLDQDIERAKGSLGLLSLPAAFLAGRRSLRASLSGSELESSLRDLEDIEKTL